MMAMAYSRNFGPREDPFILKVGLGRVDWAQILLMRKYFGDTCNQSLDSILVRSLKNF